MCAIPTWKGAQPGRCNFYPSRKVRHLSDTIGSVWQERESGVVQFDLFLVRALRAIVEVAGLALLGQGLLAVLAGKARQQNFVYQLFQVVTRPVIRAVRFITPRFILDHHMPLVSFFVLLWLWIALAFAKRFLCTLHGVSC